MGRSRENAAEDRYPILKKSSQDSVLQLPLEITMCRLWPLDFPLLSFYRGTEDISFKSILFFYSFYIAA